MGDPTCSAFDIRVEFSVCMAQILYNCDNTQQSCGFWSSECAEGTVECVRVKNNHEKLSGWKYPAVVRFMVTRCNYFLV
jgi:hypothetical protein